MSAAPYPPTTRAKGWDFSLGVERAKRSDTWLRAKTGALRGALLLLWCEAWEQEPCGSLPSDDETVALMIDMPLPEFMAVRAVLMRGWWLADDGRQYHDTIIERVLMMIAVRGTSNARQRTFRDKTSIIRARDGAACVYCGATASLSLDHLLPLSRGGDGEDGNLVTACRPCNSSKGAKTPEEWRPYRVG